MKQKTIEKEFWLATIDGEPCESFECRADGLEWLKEILQQEIKDIDRQLKRGGYTFNPELKKIEIKRVKRRETFLGA